jgi:GTP cyclohydrolase I
MKSDKYYALRHAAQMILSATDPGCPDTGPIRAGIRETPDRMAKAWLEWTSGYTMDAAAILKTFEDGAEDCGDELVMVHNIPVNSHCEHHMAAIFGTATIGYIPNKEQPKIVGLSKLSRLTDMFAFRFQVQERMGNQIADALMEHLNPLGVGVLLRCRHMCMESRGIRRHGHYTSTSALRGVVRTERETRNEFMQLATAPATC